MKCTINYPYYKGERTSMWDLIPKRVSPPTRLFRYCCEVLKEGGGAGRFIATGIRWEESNKRKNRATYEVASKERIMLNNDNDEKRMLFETCQMKAKRVVNPIIDWTEEDVWNFLHDRKVSVNPLYCEQSRVGCIGCPMAGKAREKQFERWPKYKDMYMRAFAKMLEVRKERGLKTTWNTAEEVYDWWMEKKITPGQMNFDELVDEQEE